MLARDLGDVLNRQLDEAARNLSESAVFLQRCQVDTPSDVVKGLWGLLTQYRDDVGRVFDPGAGDGRFAVDGPYREYVGYEIDRERDPRTDLPKNARIIADCAFRAEQDFDICIGNPPYVRHHDIEPLWRDTIVDIIETKSRRPVNRLANAFSYFLWQGLFATKADGLVAMIVPYEWVSRPSTKALRDYIEENGWSVDVYRFADTIFPRVMTTASITIIDKSATSGDWNYYSIDRNFEYEKLASPSGSQHSVLEYSKSRSDMYAKRGLSPGSQKVFLLTEGDRIHHGLEIGRDVFPAVSTLRYVPKTLTVLNRSSFNTYFVDMGRRCWLIASTTEPSAQLAGYLESVDPSARDTRTCRERETWWVYGDEPVPNALFSAGFLGHGPQFIENHVGAIAVGGVCGIYLGKNQRLRDILASLREVDFASRVVHHSKTLKKVEIGQMNAVLNDLVDSQ
jgi:hypothetical protein